MTSIGRYTSIVTVALCAIASYAAFQVTARAPRPAPPSMAAMLPQGALLTIESPDFAALLNSWNSSPEQKAWLASGNYSVFSNSRLFGRLNDARGEFESATTVKKSARQDDQAKDQPSTINGDFLTQIAGRQSIFAWYDVGKLEFLYITRMTPVQAAATALYKQRSAFSTRQAGGATFYLRRSADPDSGTTRTVAFAQLSTTSGDLLLLATREDLMADALQLIDGSHTDSLAQEPWYVNATAALPPTASPPALHMVLNLDRIVPLPAFRTYWVQQNITAMKQYRAAVSDLYREPGAFHEERALLLQSFDTPADQADLVYLAALTPPHSGVFRATATHSSDAAITALEEKLFGRLTLAQLPSTTAPDPTLDAPQSGSATDLETTIDTPQPIFAASSNQGLAAALKSASLDAVLTYSTALPPATPNGLWVPIHSAVILHAASAWHAETLAPALQQSLRGDLTTSTLGIDFHADTIAGQTIYALTGPKPLFFAIPSTPNQQNLWFLSDDRPLLLALLRQAAAPSTPGVPATLLAGFDHSSQRAPFARLTTLIDGTNQSAAKPKSASSNPDAAAGAATTPAFFSGNLRSLSDAFAGIASESFAEHRDGPILRQTVTYQWQRP